ncbi:MAG TPA: hypothetical protein VHA12_04045 [Candidatus Nanoarchaeia archaeon]|nr:hypothetical protein [Candidatus Nanoarchaeia archaeon]
MKPRSKKQVKKVNKIKSKKMPKKKNLKNNKVNKAVKKEIKSATKKDELSIAEDNIIKKYPPIGEYKSLVPKKKEGKSKSNITSSQIQRILNTGHPDDLYITLKLLDEPGAIKLLTYFRKNHTQMHKKKDLSKVITSAKTKAELLFNVKNYLVSSLKKEYDELKQQSSNLRKKGTDVFIEELKILTIPSKIRFFEATEDKHDFYVAKKLIDKLKQEISLKV